MKSHETSCPDVRDRLPLFVGGDVDPEVEVSVRHHLAHCEDCAERAREASRAREVFLTAFREDDAEGLSPAELWTDVRAALVREGVLSSDTNRSRRLRALPARGGRRLTLVRGVGGGIAAAAALFLGYFLARPVLDVPEASPAAADPTVTAISEVPGANPRSAGTPGMLHKLAPGDERLFESAAPVPHAHPAWPAWTGVPAGGDEASVAGHTRPARRYR